MNQQKFHTDQAHHRANRDSQVTGSPTVSRPGDSHHPSVDRNRNELPLFLNFNDSQQSRDDISIETRNFEATYTTENGTPPISVTVR